MNKAATLSAVVLLNLGLTSAQQAPQPAADAPPAVPAPAAPKPIAPAPLDKPKAKSLQITDIHADANDFDPKNSIFIFSGNVDVKNPSFHLTTDGTFEVKMKKEDKKAKAPEPEAKPAPTPGTKPEAKSLVEAPVSTPEKPGAAPAKEENNIESAVARGKMVTIEKIGDDGKMKVGQSRYAHYDGATGDMTLRDWPQVSDGENMIIAIEASTVMVLTADGKLRTMGGRTETRIIQADGKGGTKTTKSGGMSIPTPRPAQ
jgi:lipopolysaccharide export system protein LptA